MTEQERYCKQKQKLVGAKVRAMLKRRKISTRVIAKATGINQSYISSIINGRSNPTLRTIFILEFYLTKPIIKP
jgi:transcriptional regulator with XRE-family HTH domain